jgi:hypothetical protein
VSTSTWAMLQLRCGLGISSAHASDAPNFMLILSSYTHKVMEMKSKSFLCRQPRSRQHLANRKLASRRSRYGPAGWHQSCMRLAMIHIRAIIMMHVNSGWLNSFESYFKPSPGTMFRFRNRLLPRQRCGPAIWKMRLSKVSEISLTDVRPVN